MTGAHLVEIFPQRRCNKQLERATPLYDPREEDPGGAENGAVRKEHPQKVMCAEGSKLPLFPYDRG